MVAAMVVSSCGTKKKSREELSLLGKAYHNTTALYNGYFNANEIMEATYLKLDQSHKENFTELLPIFPYELANADNVKADLDRAIEKVSVVATIHKPSKWRDDCYVLLCEAQYLQQDFETVEESLRFTVKEFDPVNIQNKKKKAQRGRKSSSKVSEDNEGKSKKEINRERKKKNKKRKKKKGKRMTREQKYKEAQKKKKEEEEAKQKALEEAAKEREKELKAKDEAQGEGVFGHRPVYQDAVLWLARTYIKRDKFSLADSYLRRLEENPKIYKEVRENLYPVRAMYFIEQDRWDQAEQPMERAVMYAPDRKTKGRYAYILAQIKEKKGKYSEAEQYFDQVIDLRPNFDMIFNAQLRKAINAQRSGLMSSPEFADEMDDMLRDDKYDDYRDQIYTALAEVSFGSGDKDAGIAYLKKALAQGDKNSVYKADAYLQMADFFFEKEKYVEAKLYYDSTLTAMGEDDERRAALVELANNLTDVAKQIQIIDLQDSLIALSKLPREELIKRAEELEEAAEEAANANNPVAANTPTFNAPNLGIGKSSFFAYDNLLKDKGMRDFRKNWGDRPLEDNWRRSNKLSSSFDTEEEEEEDEEARKSDDEKLLLKYFSQVPFDKKDMELALKSKEGALFELGRLYRDNLQNCESSVETLEGLLQDFPKTEKRPDALFYLYLCALDQDQPAIADRYAKILVEEYPKSLYARSIEDPEFLEKEQNRKAELDEFYAQTFDLFSNGEYDQVRQRLNEVDNLFKNKGDFVAKFALLGAMMAGQSGGKDAYINGLRDVIAKHKDTPEATRAREIMRFLQGDDKAFQGGDIDVSNSKFKMEENKLHYVCIVIFDMGNSNLNETKIDVSQYNRKFHRKDKLNLSTLDLDIDNSTPMILVRKFKTMEKAMDYYYAVKKRDKQFIKSNIQYEVFAISQRNYREVIKERSVNTYRPWFEENYLVEED